mgnify:CR=1 FL=1
MKKKKVPNYYTSRILVGIFLFTVNLTVCSMPELGSECKVFKPRILKDYIVKESQLTALVTPDKKKKKVTYGQEGPSTNEFWNVYSDRSENNTYEEPALDSKKCGSLDFNEEVIIAKIENDFALVYTESGSQPHFPQIPRNAKCKGWIPIKNLLLWSSCPANERGIYNKAIIVGNIDKLKSSGDNTIGLYYKNPATKSGKDNLQSNMKFYFVMKKDPETGMHLLSNYSKLGKQQQELFGWVSEGMYAPWSQRTCLESNWKKEALENLKGAKIPIGLIQYSNPKKKAGATITTTLTEAEIGKRRNNVSNSEAFAYRWMPRTLRYPILENNIEQGLYKITAFANIGGRDASIDDFSASLEKVQKVLDNMREINLIFVIDGTKGMERYFKTVQTAITRASGNDYFGRENRTIRVGLVIYRDHSDGNYVTEFLSMRKPTDRKLEDWLKKGGEYGIKNSPNDHSDYEALYEGLKVALDAGKMGYSRTQSNLMFVIGDCGNDPNNTGSITQEEIIKKCIENRIQLSSFNVRNIDTGPYQQFRKQMARIVMKNMEGQYAQLGEAAKHEYVPLADGYDFKPGTNTETTLFVGSFRNVESGREMTDKQLYSLVYSTSQKVNEAIARQEKIMEDAENIVINKSGNASQSKGGNNAASEIEMKYLETMLDATTINGLRKTGFMLAFEGYTPQRNANGQDYWQPVIYISHPELVSLLDQLKHVNDEVDKQSDDREAYVNAMKSLAASMIGDVSEDEILKMKNEDIMDMVTGLNVKTEALNYRLVDIQNKKKVGTQEYRELTTRFVEQYNKLDGIRQKKYPFSYKDNDGETWYWIPAEDLP